MAEDPIKLFATRSERFPQSDDSDSLRAALEKVTDQIPIAGPIAAYVFGQFFRTPLEERREEWFKELADDFEKLREKDEKFSVENLTKNETFVTAMIQTTRIALGTHLKEKRKYLRNALLNIAAGRTKDETRQQIFLNAIESFAVAHVRLLNLIWRGAGQKIPWDENRIDIRQRNYGTAAGIVDPELKGQPALAGAVFADLRNRGFSNLGGPEQTFPQGGIITNLGVEFLYFVLSPDDLPK